MTEPSTSTITIATASVALTGRLFGLHFDALLLGLLGGMIALQHLGPMTRWAMASSLATAAVFAAALSPIATAAAAEYAAWTARMSQDTVRVAAAFVLGVAAQTLIPLGIAALRVFAARWGVRADAGDGGKS